QRLTPFQAVNQLDYTISQMAVASGLPNDQSVSNARVLVVGPRLGDREPICGALRSSAASLLQSFKARNVRVVFVEVSPNPLSSSPKSFVSAARFEQTSREGIYRCVLQADGIATSYVIDPNYLSGVDLRNGTFAALAQF